MSNILGWAAIAAIAAGIAALDRWTRPLGQRWAARIDAWFDRHEGGDRR